MCDCCDRIIGVTGGYRGFNEQWHRVCSQCARKYKWYFLEDCHTGRVLIDSIRAVYLPDDLDKWQDADYYAALYGSEY